MKGVVLDRLVMLLLDGQVSHCVCFLSLPYEDVVDHRTTAEDDPQTDEDARYDCRGRMELYECIQDYP